MFVGDSAGGFIAALIALPYGLSMASLMGLPPVLGLFTSILTAPITALLGRNPVLIGGTASATIPFIQAAVAQQGIGGAAKVCLVAAGFMMIFSTLRMGGLISKIPPTVVSGFSCGIGAMMVIQQLKTMFGLKFASEVGSNNSLYAVWQVGEHMGAMRWQPFVLAAIVVTVCYAVARWNHRLPAPLIGVVVALGVNALLGLHEAQVGAMPFTLPPFAGFTWKPTDMMNVVPSGFFLALISSVNILVTSRVVEHFRGRHEALGRSDADAELGAYGIANVCAGFFGAPLSVGIPARSLANVRCGGVTSVSNLMHGVVMLLFVVAGSSAIAILPLPALAGVTVYVGLCLLEWGTWRRLPKMRRLDAVAFVVTAIAILLVNAVLAVAMGCAIYGAHYLYVKARSPRDANLAQPATSRVP